MKPFSVKEESINYKQSMKRISRISKQRETYKYKEIKYKYKENIQNKEIYINIKLFV